MAEVIDGKERFKLIKPNPKASKKIYQFQLYQTEDGLIGLNNEPSEGITYEEMAILICELRKATAKLEQSFADDFPNTTTDEDEVDEFNPYLDKGDEPD